MSHIVASFTISCPNYGASGPAGYYFRIHVNLGSDYGWAATVPLSEVPAEILTLDREQLLAHPWTAPFLAQAHADLLPKLDAQVTKLTTTIAETRAHLPEAV
jgi:hypothetical protein